MTPDTTDNAMIENTRPRRALASLRMRYANLLAAARATLSAARDGETNPLAYLVDELAAQGQLPPDGTGSPIRDTDAPDAWLNPANRSAEDWTRR